jgi:hypothetical protein
MGSHQPTLQISAPDCGEHSYAGLGRLKERVALITAGDTASAAIGNRIRSRRLFRATAKARAKEFGGVTAYTRAPAEGLWQRPGVSI